MKKQDSWKPEGIPVGMSVGDYLDRLVRKIKQEHLAVDTPKKKTKKKGTGDLF